MAYTLDTVVPAGAAGLTDLRAQLYDTAGSNVGSAITTGFVDLGTGFYHWHYASFPDAHRGGVKFYSAAASSVILSAVAINPEEGEYTNAKSSLLATAASIAALNNLSAAQVATELATYDAPTKAEMDAGLALLATASALATVAGYIDTEVAAIKAKTDNLPASPAATGDIPSAATNASTLLASVLESGKTVAQAILDLWAKEVGRATANSADSPTSITYRSPDDTVQITHTHSDTTRAVS